MNAICHRDYYATGMTYVRLFADRVEIANPGHWVGRHLPEGGVGIQLNELAGESMPTNYRLAQGLAAIDLSEVEGSGLPSAAADCSRLGAPAPLVKHQDNYVVVTIFPRDIGRRTPVRDESGYRIDSPFDHGNDTTINSQRSPPDTGSELVALLNEDSNKNFIFLFGAPASGKTTIIGSLIHGMQRPEVKGKLFLHGTGDSRFRHGFALWDQIRRAFDQRTFPTRTASGATIQLHVQYKAPNAAEALDIVFLEMAGEDLRQVQITDQGARSLPFHIGQFLRIPQLSVTFLIATAWQEATRDDSLIDDFLSYVAEVSPHVLTNRVVLLVTKWDTNPDGATVDVADFVREKMPRTFNKLSEAKNLVLSFSIGRVVRSEEGEYEVIATFDHQRSQMLFSKLYETLTGKQLDRQSLWKRLLTLFR